MPLITKTTNVLDALGMKRFETPNSGSVALLLSPERLVRSKDSSILKALLQTMITKGYEYDGCNKNSAKETSYGEQHDLLDAQVETEKSFNGGFEKIDVLITSAKDSFALCIETKVDSDEHDKQTQRYYKDLITAYPNYHISYLFLTCHKYEKPLNTNFAWLRFDDFRKILLGADNKIFTTEGLVFLKQYLDYSKRLDYSSIINDYFSPTCDKETKEDLLWYLTTERENFIIDVIKKSSNGLHVFETSGKSTKKYIYFSVEILEQKSVLLETKFTKYTFPFAIAFLRDKKENVSLQITCWPVLANINQAKQTGAIAFFGEGAHANCLFHTSSQKTNQLSSSPEKNLQDFNDNNAEIEKMIKDYIANQLPIDIKNCQRFM
jgi:hypothetical protein